PHDDMGLAEVPQAPSQRRDHGEVGTAGPEGFAAEEAEETGIDVRDVVDHGRRAAGVDDGDDRYGDEGGEHQQPLGNIGQRRAQESAEERVDHGDGGDEEHSAEVVEAEAGFEELAGGDHARRDVEREEHEDDDSAEDAQQPGTVLEALLEEAGNRDRVTGLLRERAQARGHDLPIDP